MELFAIAVLQSVSSNSFQNFNTFKNRGCSDQWWQKLGAFLYNVTIQLASHLDVLYTVEFSFRFNGSQQRSTCVFGAHIQVSLREFFEGSILSKAQNLSNIL